MRGYYLNFAKLTQRDCNNNIATLIITLMIMGYVNLNILTLMP